MDNVDVWNAIKIICILFLINMGASIIYDNRNATGFIKAPSYIGGAIILLIASILTYKLYHNIKNQKNKEDTTMPELS